MRRFRVENRVIAFEEGGVMSWVLDATPPSAEFPPVSSGRLWMGLGGPDDWEREHLVMNVMKTARRWGGHLPGQYGGGDSFVTPVLDADGYPTSIPAELESIYTLLLTEQATTTPASAINGRYRFTYDGEGTFTINGVTNRTDVSVGVIEFDYVASLGGLVDLRILTINPANYPRNFKLFKTEYAARMAAGFITRPGYEWAGVGLLRFMDLQKTNQIHLLGHSGPGTEARATSFSWNMKGISVLEICQIANELGINPWVNIPHTANDAYVTAMATTIRDNLNPALKCYVEWSNEIWNFQFQQTQFCFPAALARFGTQAGDAWMQYAGSRSSQCMSLFASVFAGQMSRIVRVAGAQLNYEGIEIPFLDAPLWVALGNPAPRLSFDAYAVTGYFSPDVQEAPGADTLLALLAAEGYQAAVDYCISRLYGPETVVGSLAELFGFWDYHRGVATARGFDLLMYEGGTHAVGIGSYQSNITLATFLNAYNYSPEIAEVYRDVMQHWDTIGDGPFNQFVTFARPTQFGSWGALRYIGDSTARSQILLDYNEAPLVSITPEPLNQRLIVTGHSIPDAFIRVPLADGITAMGGTIQRWSSTGPYASANFRWNNRPVNPDEVRGLMEAGGASYDAFVGIEAHGDTVFIAGDPVGRASVATHINFSDAYGYALLWHNLAASTGAQPHYMNFWRNDPPQVFGANWRAAQVPEIPLWDGIIDYVNANRAGGTPQMRLVPLLQVFCAVYDAIQASAVTGITMASLFEDDVHQNTPIGRWISMATLLAVVYRRHPDELPANAGTQANISTGLAAQLRPIVWATCLATARTGLA